MLLHVWKSVSKSILLFLTLCLFTRDHSYAQQESGCEVRGTVVAKNNGKPLHAVSVTIVPLGRTALSDEQGRFIFRNIPPGSWELTSHMHAFTGESKRIEVISGQDLTVDLALSLSPLKYDLTVTASGREVTAFDAFQSVAVVDSLELSEQSSFGLGDVVARESGVHKRSFGPGSSRPIIRGFDGDRVLVLNDGLSSGTLSSQSGEHAEPVDSANLEKIEIVKGPATLLYGSNAIGGVLNMVTEHHMLHEHPHPGLRGQITTIGGTNTHQAAVHANAEFGHKNWLIWSSGSRQAAGDYWSPDARILNSKTRMTSGSLGLGWYAGRPFFNLSYSFNKGRLGVPFAGEFHRHHEEEREAESHDHEEEDAALVDETFTWQNIRFNTGMKGLNSLFEEYKISANFSRWIHKELENEETATSFDNKLFNLRTTFTQRRHSRFSGTSGFHFFHRNYSAEGEEALSPPVAGDGIAFFTLQEIDLEMVRLQFGGRVDHTRYAPAGMADRSFTGFSGAAGIHIPLSKTNAFVANYTHSYRAPAIEELYNYGPHIGNLAFEIGDPNLKREVAGGIDLSLRRQDSRFNAELNFYYYAIRDFVYLNLTGEEEHGLRAAAFSQADARFLGGEAQMSLGVHSNFWINGGMDIVNAELTGTGAALPRIPPLRGRLGFDARWRGLSFKPEVVMAAAQARIYPTETRTPGYTVLNMNASCTLAGNRLMHIFSVGVFNAGDRLYRNHLSFIKDLAPEMGRSVRFTYSLNLL